MSTSTNPPATERLALAAPALAKLLDISERHLWASHAAGRIPRPLRLGRSTRWNRAEIQAWLDAGAPARDRWEQMRNGGGA